MKSNYYEKKEQRIECLKELAEKNEKLSTQAYETANKIGSYIPMGQPILVGHHSEKRHRRDIEKIDNNMRKSVELSNKAQYYEDRVQAAESNTAISSDNPDALELLKEKLDKLQKYQETMKEINKILKSAKTTVEQKKEQLLQIMPEKYISKIMTPDFAGRIGYSYHLTNNNGNMARIKERIAGLEKIAAMVTEEVTINDIRIVADVEKNRVQIFFPGKPSEEIRTKLKYNGYRWAPSEMAWQKNLSGYAFHQAKNLFL